MTEINIHDFNREVDCIYDNELFSVRDNGAVLRHSRSGKRFRSADKIWTFGKPNSQNGYMYISGTRIHRIVATAFHGEAPTKMHVVDHIDTNRRNNRPENLRWVTRLENALLNPITVKRIEIICGSVEAFLENPSLLGNSKYNRKFEWMRTVTPEEAKACKECMQMWANSRNQPSGGSLGEWVYKSIHIPNQIRLPKTSVRSSDLESNPYMPSEFSYQLKIEEKERIEVYAAKLRASDLVMAKTQGAAQRKWLTPSEFPCCPQNPVENPIKTYAEKLTTDAVFARNQFSTSMVLESTIVDSGQSILVMSQAVETNAMKPWSIAKVTYEDGLYVHTSCGTFFMKDGAEKAFCLARGLEWTGGDIFDDFC